LHPQFGKLQSRVAADTLLGWSSMGFPTLITRGCRIIVAGAVLISGAELACAQAARLTPGGDAQAEPSTLSMAPQRATHVDVSIQTVERMGMVVFGASPTLHEPATPPGIDSLGGRREVAKGSRKTAWMDYMLAPVVPAWSLRLTAKSGFEMNGSGQQSVAIPPALVTEGVASGGGYGNFGFSGVAPTNRATPLAPGAWTAFGDAGARSALLPTPITSLRAATVDVSGANLVPTQLSVPPSTAGTAAGAAPMPLPSGK
jgi:hypothetical protein